ncbi:MAG: YbhB/YbcL family Raf kinase inhibitor-like protein [Desulfobacteraceae bacterium]|nr:YbhB/YbcL family Raf kinase inhibitor-like protein [Desulfobacteraceae bacterium]
MWPAFPPIGQPVPVVSGGKKRRRMMRSKSGGRLGQDGMRRGSRRDGGGLRAVWVLGLAWLLLMTGLAQAFTLRGPGDQLSLDQVYSGFGCSGRNISPELDWSQAPTGAKSFAVTGYDPDAPGQGWWHWLVWNIPASASGLKTGAGGQGANLLPPGSVQGRNDFGDMGYGGACPPLGDKPHRYVFTVYALDRERLDLDPKTTPTLAEAAIKSHALAWASLVSRYQR